MCIQLKWKHTLWYTEYLTGKEEAKFFDEKNGCKSHHRAVGDRGARHRFEGSAELQQRGNIDGRVEVLEYIIHEKDLL